MRLKNFINEQSNKGYGITFIDIDETIFKTFAKIKVIDNKGNIIKKLDNKEYNSYKLPKNCHFDFSHFKNSEFFNKTSIPIDKTIKRIKKMLSIINDNSKIIFLTARGDFDDKETFLDTFKKYGIDISKIYVERAGNNIEGTIEITKKNIIMKYLKSGIYRRVRLIDDYINNLKEFLKIKNEIPNDILDKVIKTYNLKNDDIPIKFFALLIDKNGSLKLIN